MRAALDLALGAERAGEVPVGALVVRAGEVVGRGENRQLRDSDPTAHAEIVAVRRAARRLGERWLSEATVYSTLEPCAMCAGALVAARVRRLVFAARDLRFGAVRSKFRLADSDLLNHRVDISEGVLAGECLEALRGFFAARRRPGSGGRVETLCGVDKTQSRTQEWEIGIKSGRA